MSFRTTKTAPAVCLLLASCAPLAPASEPVNGLAVPAVYRITLTREAQRIWGPAAPVARFAAQIHTESAWRPEACSWAGACGLGQQIPSTAAWLAEIYTTELNPPAPHQWRWSIRAMLIYDRHIYLRQLDWVTDGDRWAAALVGYVGGPGWLRRERLRAAGAGDDPGRWWGSVESHCLRGAQACRDSRHYPRRILCELEPHYVRAGWPGKPVCREAP